MTFLTMNEVGAVYCVAKHTYKTDQWATEHDLELKVHVLDIDENDMLDEKASSKWRSCPSVHEIILSVTDNFELRRSEEIKVYQDDSKMQEDTLSDCQSDEGRTNDLVEEHLGLCRTGALGLGLINAEAHCGALR